MRLAYRYHKLECTECGRKVLVERHVNGSDHCLRVSVTCAACVKLPLPEGFVSDAPEAAAHITEWLEGNR